MHDLIRLMECFYQTKWCIHDSYLKTMELLLHDAFHKQLDESVLQEHMAAVINARSAKTLSSTQSIGVIPIHGSIGHRASFLSEYFGWPTTESIGANIQQMVNDSNVSAIILDINSPGGMAVGNEELHNLIMENKGKKPIVALANGMAASAAYYIASAADEIAVIPSGEVGSIGTVMLHADYSKMFADAGINLTVIKAGKYKWEGHPYAPLTDEAKDHLQEEVDAHNSLFVNAVARGRGVSASKVKADYGQGRMLMAQDALNAGMVDRIATFKDIVSGFGGMSSQMQMREGSPITEALTEVRVELGESATISCPKTERLKLRNKLLAL